MALRDSPVDPVSAARATVGAGGAVALSELPPPDTSRHHSAVVVFDALPLLPPSCWLAFAGEARQRRSRLSRRGIGNDARSRYRGFAGPRASRGTSLKGKRR